MYCGEQIQIPEDLGAVLKQFTKAAIRDAPSEDAVLKWAANYFAVMSGQQPPFDESGRLLSEGGGRKPGTTGSAAGGDMVTDVMEGAAGFESVDGQGEFGDKEASQGISDLLHSYDKQGNGRIERAELPAIFTDIKTSLGVDVSEDQVSEVMALLDTDEDGTVSLDELKKLIL
eukprot:CAMPEP_0174851508 /NCGR_PEP_ID=MMETSP1114-20130205/23230_1 /TAXON_ID=312471 /ORGANISM="Neobodo designis, Strain CCAP 1951/1" /LENGTH=172 /DNA_ID=CAMNT_0016086049 /DNA_START=38 /DNA_END=556 /DNA_ORIENTATION=+